MESGSSLFRNRHAIKIGRWVCLTLVLVVIGFGVRFGISAISLKRSVGEKIPLPKSLSAEMVSVPPVQGLSAEDSLLCRQAETSFKNKKWEEAVSCYTVLFEKKPNNGRYAFYLAYSLHAAGRIDDAIVAHKKAATFPNFRALATYNLACAYSLLENRQMALETLQRAIDFGFFSRRDPIGNDSNFDYIKDDPLFKKLEQIALPVELRTIYRQFDFWIGTWDIYNDKGQLIGGRTVTKNSHSGGLNVTFFYHQGRSGTGFSYVDPEDMKWKQFWFEENGVSLKYVGGLKNGKMQFVGKAFGKGIQNRLRRATFEPTSDGNVLNVIEISNDSGKTWTVDFKCMHRRAEPAAR